MNLIINGTGYKCTGRPRFDDPVRIALPDTKPDAAALGDELVLVSDDGFELRRVDISGMTTRRYFDGNDLVVTSTPEPEPEPEPVPSSTPTVESRVTALETETGQLTAAVNALVNGDTEAKA